MRVFWQDLRYGLRLMSRSPGFTSVALLTLALGIGANAAIFSVVYGVALRPLDYRDPGQIVVLHGSHPERGTNPYGTSKPDFESWRDQAESFEAMGLFAYWTFNLTDRDIPERLVGGRVGGAFFPVLGVSALMGRALEPSDDRPARSSWRS